MPAEPAPRAPASRPALVLLDLDGTLADTFPDLAWALDRALEEHGLAPGDRAAVRARVSAGARAMTAAALAGRRADAAAVERRFLDLYDANVAVRTRLFDGMAPTLDSLERAGCALGVVTNKASRFTAPLVTHLGLAARLRCVVSGDTAARPKPHPDPLLHAARSAGIALAACVYVGDSRNDILAARAAGMPVAAACWGYPDDDPAEAWGADALLARPADLLRWTGVG